MKEIVWITRIEDRPMARHCKPLSDKSSSSRRFWNVKERDFPVLNPEGFDLKKDDYAEVELPPGEAVKSAFLLFILPILLFLLVYLMTPGLGKTAQVVLSLAGLFGGFFIPLMLKRLGRPEALPRVMRKLTPEEARSELRCEVGCPGCGGCG